MGMMGRILGLGSAVQGVGAAVGGVAEVFVGNEAERDAAQNAEFLATLDQYGAEFTRPGTGWFNGFVNGLNRLPRPMLALGTLGLFGYAMAEPAGFSVRMQGLAFVPDPLWWLLGAIVSFYFGARELHYLRRRPGPVPQPVALPGPGSASAAQTVPQPAKPPRPTTAPRPAQPAPAPAPAPIEIAPLPAPAAPPLQAGQANGTMGGTAVDPADPTFNAAIAEWHRMRR